MLILNDVDLLIEKKLIGARARFFPCTQQQDTKHSCKTVVIVFTVHFFKHTTALSRRSSESECVCVVLVFVSICSCFCVVFYAFLHFCCFCSVFVCDGVRDRLVFLVFFVVFCLVDGILSRFILFSLNSVAF